MRAMLRRLREALACEPAATEDVLRFLSALGFGDDAICTMRHELEQEAAR